MSKAQSEQLMRCGREEVVGWLAFVEVGLRPPPALTQTALRWLAPAELPSTRSASRPAASPRRPSPSSPGAPSLPLGRSSTPSPQPVRPQSFRRASRPQLTTALLCTAASAGAAAASSCPPGTVLKGLNYLKDGQDPVALEDSEYPAWVFALPSNKAATTKGDKGDPAVELRKQRAGLKKATRAAIKASNDLKG